MDGHPVFQAAVFGKGALGLQSKENGTQGFIGAGGHQENQDRNKE